MVEQRQNRRGVTPAPLRLLLGAIVAAVGAIVALLPTAANAQEGGPVGSGDPAAALEKRGAEAAARGDPRACVEAYVAAQTAHTSPSPLIAGELGLCEESLGWYALAYDQLVSALEAEPPRPGGAARTGPWKRYGEALDRVKEHVARVIVVVEPDDAEVFVDGHPLGAHVDGRFFVVEPGRHTWTARLGGHRDAVYVHTVRAGDLPTAHLVLEPVPEPIPVAGRGVGPRRVGPNASTSREVLEEPPCAAADGERMSPKLCGVFERLVYRGRVNPTLGVALGGLLSVGFTADVGPGIFGGVDLRWFDKDDFGFVLTGEVRGVFPAKAGIRDDGKAEDLWTLTFGVAPCLRYKWALGCAVFDGGWMFATGPQPDYKTNTGLTPNVGIGPRLGLDLPIMEHFGIRAFADLRFSPLPTDLSYNRQVIWNSPVVSGLFGVGVSFK